MRSQFPLCVDLFLGWFGCFMVASRLRRWTLPASGAALIEAYQEDASALRRFHPWRMSMARHQRMGTLIEQFSHRLNGIGFTSLSQEERIDYLLFKTVEIR